MEDKYLNVSFDITDTTKQNDGVIIIEGYANRTKDNDGNTIVDRDGDVVVHFGLDNYLKNPIILYQHDHNKPAGKALDIATTDKGLYIKAEVHRDVNPEAYNAVKSQVVKTFSIGFRGKSGMYDPEMDIYYYMETELLEVSIVSVPANQDSTFDIVDTPCGNGFCLADKHYKSTTSENIKAIKIDNKNISTTQWGDVDKTKLKNDLKEDGSMSVINEAFLYVEDKDKTSTWCCPHHELKNGTLVVNKDGVIAAYAALKGAHGNKPNMSDADYNKAMKHIAKHYKELSNQGFINDIPEDIKAINNDDTSEKGSNMTKEEMLELLKEFKEELLVTLKSEDNLEVDEPKEGIKDVDGTGEITEEQSEPVIDLGSFKEFVDNVDINNDTIEDLVDIASQLTDKINSAVNEYLGAE